MKGKVIVIDIAAMIKGTLHTGYPGALGPPPCHQLHAPLHPGSEDKPCPAHGTALGGRSRWREGWEWGKDQSIHK